MVNALAREMGAVGSQGSLRRRRPIKCRKLSTKRPKLKDAILIYSISRKSVAHPWTVRPLPRCSRNYGTVAASVICDVLIKIAAAAPNPIANKTERHRAARIRFIVLSPAKLLIDVPGTACPPHTRKNSCGRGSQGVR